MDSTLNDLLHEWEETIRAHAPGAVAQFAAGLDEQDVVETLEGHDLYPEDQILTVFSWHNGYTPDADITTFLTPVGTYLIDLQGAEWAYPKICTRGSSVGWYPIMRARSGFVTVDARKDSATRGAVRIWKRGEPESTPCNSLREVLRWWLQAFHTNKWQWDPVTRQFRSSFAAIDLTDDQLKSELLAPDLSTR